MPGDFDEARSPLVPKLVAALEPLPAERAVISAVFRHARSEHTVAHASVLIGPAAMSRISWSDWERKGLASDLGPVPKDLPAAFRDEHQDVLMVRQPTSIRRAARWLSALVETGRSDHLGLLPSCISELSPPKAPALVDSDNDTPAAGFISCAARPVRGFLFRSESPSVSVPSLWSVGGLSAVPHRLVGIAVPVDDGVQFETPTGVFLGRLSREAWIARMKFDRDDQLLEIGILMERARVDPEDLEIQVEEFVDGELADARRLALADIALRSNVRGRINVRMPTLGRRVKRTIRLYSRGRLIHEKREFNFVERLQASFSIGGDPPAMNSVIGDTRDEPTLEERLHDLAQVEAAYQWWFGRGAKRRIIAGRDVTSYVARRIARAKEELLILDPYFGADATDWDLLKAVSVPVRVLTGWKGKKPPGKFSNVKARKWVKAPVPFHDRFYFWQERGLSIGASPGGLIGDRAFRIDELKPAEVRILRTSFEEWWTSASSRSLERS